MLRINWGNSPFSTYESAALPTELHWRLRVRRLAALLQPRSPDRHDCARFASAGKPFFTRSRSERRWNGLARFNPHQFAGAIARIGAAQRTSPCAARAPSLEKIAAQVDDLPRGGPPESPLHGPGGRYKVHVCRVANNLVHRHGGPVRVFPKKKRFPWDMLSCLNKPGSDITPQPTAKS